MEKDYPRLHSIVAARGLLVETCEGMGTKESPCHQGLYFALESEDGNYRIYRIVEDKNDSFIDNYLGDGRSGRRV